MLGLIVDVGCGVGCDMVWFVLCGFDVCGYDVSVVLFDEVWWCYCGLMFELVVLLVLVGVLFGVFCNVLCEIVVMYFE